MAQYFLCRFYEWKRSKDTKQPYYIYFPQNKDKNSNLTEVKVEDIKTEKVKVKIEDTKMEAVKVKVEDVKVKEGGESIKIQKEDSGFYEASFKDDLCKSEDPCLEEENDGNT